MSNALILGALHASRTRLPFFDAHIPAGFPSPALDHMEHRLSLDELLDVDAPHTYLVRVTGDSMTGVGIFDEDILIVSRAITKKIGRIVVADLNGETFVKRLTQQDDQYVLRSENPKYPPRYIMEGDELVAWGVVKANVHMHHCHA